MKKHSKLQELPLHLMMLPSVILVFIFSYIPLFGLVIAFQKFSPGKGILHSKWVGWKNFEYVFNLPTFTGVIRNTLVISISKLILHIIIPLIFALLLNEITSKRFKKTIQTVTYLPHFLSWVILGGIMINILSPSTGIINNIIKVFGGDPVFFLGTAKIFPYTIILSDIWKETGFSAVIYLAALTGIDPTLYEAAVVDGAGRLKQTWYITLACLVPTVVLMGILSMGNILNAGFDQIMNLYSIPVYSTGDIIDTFVYRLGLKDFQFSVATAVGLFKSAISTIMVLISYRLAYKTTGYKVL